MTTGSLTDYLGTLGYKDCYMASVGPLSSAWDRACELYAQLSGTVVDYGAAHSAKYGHARYGRDYSENGYGQLIPGYKWSETNKVNLVGHSFGGATSRLLISLLANGDDGEQAAAGDTCSELFKGHHENMVYSLTMMAAPSNGTTFIEANSDFTYLVANFASSANKVLGISMMKGVYDFQLEHFGIYKDSNEYPSQTLDRVLKSDFLSHYDNAFADLTIDKALKLNERIGDLPDTIYYFSYYGNRTTENPITHNYVPTVRMYALLQPFGYTMGKYQNKYTAGYYKDGYMDNSTIVEVPQTYITREWLASDGMVNVISGKVPGHYVDGVIKYDDSITYSNQTEFKPGIWYVMPEQNFDHLGIVGGLFNETPTPIHKLYKEVMSNISKCV